MKIFRLIFISLIVFNSHLINAQVPNWEWAEGWNGNSGSGNAICTDRNGNVYVTGYFQGTNVAFGNDILIGLGGYDMGFCVVKYDSTGNILWAKNAGKNESSVIGNSVTTDITGNVYVTGFFYDSAIVFGDIILVNNSFGLNSKQNGFIVKYDPLGNVLWAKGIGNDEGVGINGICADANSNIYVIGNFSGILTVGSDTLRNSGIFLAKFNSSGNAIWAECSTETNSNLSIAKSINMDMNGYIYITGSFYVLSFGSYSLDDAGAPGAFLAKFDLNGNIQWLKSAGSPNSTNIYGTSVSSDATGNTYITGEYGTAMQIGTFTLPGVTTNAIYIAKYDPSGNVMWAKGTGQNDSYTFANGISVNSEGNVIVTGSYTTQIIVFDTITLGNQSGNTNVFLVEYDPSGNIKWAKEVGSSAGSNSNAIATDAFGNAFITGWGSELTFGDDTLITTAVFVAKLGYGIWKLPLAPSGPVNIYPNPSNGSFHFSGLNETSTIEVYGMMGQYVNSIIYRYSGFEGISLYIPDDTKGVYFYRVKDQGSTIQQGKLVVE